MPESTNKMRRLASRYVWWKTPDEAMQFPRRIMAQVMNMGGFDDMQELAVHAGMTGYLSRFGSK